MIFKIKLDDSFPIEQFHVEGFSTFTRFFDSNQIQGIIAKTEVASLKRRYSN